MNNYQIRIEHGDDRCYLTIYENNMYIDSFAGLLEEESELVEKAKKHIEWLKINGALRGTIYKDDEREIIRHVRGDRDTLTLKYKNQLVCEVLSWPDTDIKQPYQDTFDKLLNYNEVVKINKTKVIEL